MALASRRGFASGVLALGFGTAAGIARARSDEFTVEPRLDLMSEKNRNRLISLLAKSSLNTLRGASSADTEDPDPDWPEMWIQMRPKDAESFRGQLPDNVVNYWLAYPEQRALVNGDFGEEAYTEISGPFAQTCSPSGCESDSRPSNTFVVIKAIENGKRVDDPSFYADIMKAIAGNKP